MGLLLAGRDPVAVDRVLASLMGFGELGLFEVAREMGLGQPDRWAIPTGGVALPPVLDPPFALPIPGPLTFHPLRRALGLLSGRAGGSFTLAPGSSGGRGPGHGPGD